MSAQPVREWGFATTREASGYLPSATQRSNRRRLRVFIGTLIVSLIVSLAYTFLRPAVYRASTRFEIAPAGAAPSSAPATIAPSEPVKPFFTEVQVLTSRPLLEQVIAKLQQAGHPVSDAGGDPIATMQSRIEAVPVENTNVVELVAKMETPRLLAPLLNTIVEVYHDRLMDGYRTTSSEAIAQADGEVKKIEETVASKRREVEAYRLRNNIVSLERDENEVLARVRNQGNALGKANERVATAEGNLRALTDAQAAGNAVVRARDNPTLANLEQRASQVREELSDLERAYTADYLAKDPRAVALRARLAQLDRQVVEQRRIGHQTALAEAQEELSSAQAAARKIESQMNADRQDVAQFTARFNEYKARQDSLAQLEKLQGDAVQRRARLEASEQARMPKVRVLEMAAAPTEPWRPLYWRDAAISVGGSLVLALLAMWLTELFNRSDPAPTLIVAAPGLPQRMMPQELPALAASHAMVANEPRPLLPPMQMPPRELGQEEVTALMTASDDTIRLATSLLMSGLDADEAIALQRSDVDLDRGAVHVRGAAARDVALTDPLRELLAPRSSTDERVLALGGLPVTTDTLDAQILCAAHDARLASAPEVDARCLRHTYIAWLVRQGIRFADLQRVVGPLSAPALGAYAAISPSGTPVPRESIDMTYPSLRRPGEA